MQLLETSPLYASTQQRLRRLRKRYLKVKSRCFKLFRAFSISYRSSNAGIFFVELNSRRLLRVQENEKASSCLVFTSSTKREIRQFHIVVLQRRQIRVQNACCTCRVAVLQSKPIAVLPFSLACSAGVFWAGQIVVNMALLRAKHSRARKKTSALRATLRATFSLMLPSSLLKLPYYNKLISTTFSKRSFQPRP